MVKEFKVIILTIILLFMSQKLNKTKYLPSNTSNNNPLNIRYNKANDWLGRDTSHSGAFERFLTLEFGIRAACKVLITYNTKYGLTTIKDIITKFAPPIENDTVKYIKFVSQKMGVSSSSRLLLNVDILASLVSEMSIMEKGQIGSVSSDSVKKVIEKFNLI